MQTSQPLVSVIIPTKNEEKNIRTILHSIKDQTYSNIEIIVIDNNSPDKTCEIAKKYTPHVIQKGPERSTQRNYGVEISRGEYVLIVDADMKLEKTVIGDCVAQIQCGADCVIIPEDSYGSTFWAQCKWVEKRCYHNDDTIEAARFYKKNVYQNLNGFDTSLISGEDWDFMIRTRKAGYKVSRITSLIHHNEGALKLGTTLKKKFYYGQKLMPYIQRNTEEFKAQSSFIRPAFIRNWKFLLANPIKTFGMFFMKACEFGAFGVGIMKSKIARA